MLGMLGNPKKVASLIIAGMSKDGAGNDKSYSKKVNGTEKSSEDFTMIADDMVNCIENKDREGLASCIKSLLSALESRLANKGEEDNMMEDEDSEEM